MHDLDKFFCRERRIRRQLSLAMEAEDEKEV
jgi:hypothetical protein